MSGNVFIEYDIDGVTYRFDAIAEGVAGLVAGTRYYAVIKTTSKPGLVTETRFYQNDEFPARYVDGLRAAFATQHYVNVVAVDVLKTGEGWLIYEVVHNGKVERVDYKDDLIISGQCLNPERSKNIH